MRLGVVDNTDRGVLLQQFGERLPELDVVLALLGGDRNGEHRRMRSDLGDWRMRLRAVAQGLSGLGVVELAERDGLAGLRRPALLAGLTHELENRRDTSRLPVGGRDIGAVADLSR